MAQWVDKLKGFVNQDGITDEEKEEVVNALIAGRINEELIGLMLGEDDKVVSRVKAFYRNMHGRPTSAFTPTASPVLGIAPSDTQVKDAYARVSRLFHQEDVIGTAIRLDKGVILTCRHCVIEDGFCLPDLRAFGEELQFVGAYPSLDVAVFRGPSGPAFRLALEDVQVGCDVQLLSYPQAIDQELQLSLDSYPAMDSGIVSQMSDTGMHGIATFSTVMPNSSGGAVVTDTCTLVGMHVGSVWHLQELPEGSDGGNGGGSSGSSSSAAPSTVELAGSEPLWVEPASGSILEAATSDSHAAHLSRINIEHKGDAALFVPARALRRCLMELKLFRPGPVDAAAARLKKQRGKY